MRINSSSPKRSRERNGGYVLIMTLVLIAIAALASAGLARRSLVLAQQSIEQQRELQRRWGAHSCQRTLLGNAEDIFLELEDRHQEEELPWPAPSLLQAEVNLAGMKHRLRLTDENARLNLNEVTARFPEQRRQLLFHLVDNGVSLKLRPNISPQAVRKKRWFTSWGQLVSLNEIWRTRSLGSMLEAVSEITCWGNGKLNLRRTNDPVLYQIVGKVISQDVASKLLETRSESDNMELSELLAAMGLRRSQQVRLRRWLTDESSCFALWLELDHRGQRWYYHWVRGDGASPMRDSVISFVW